MGESRSADITNAYISYLKEHKPEFSMCIFDSPDAEGHGYGWGSEEYMKRLPEIDAYIAQIVEATKEAGIYDETIFMIVSDHGGINKGHGSISMSEMEAPLVFFGPGVKKGYKSGERFTYYFGSAWSKNDCRNQNEWQLRIESFLNGLNQPLDIEIK
jgi:predicted AlkP superfamily pyrophosphatase or phosphodiesterase